MNWPAIISIFAAGFGCGCSFGVFMMASIRVGARYDRETESMLDDFDYEPVPHVTRNCVEYDFRSNK
jgi:hypothetical protein